MDKASPKRSRLRTYLSRAESWPLLAQVAGSMVACFAIGMILGLAYGLLAGGLTTVALGIVNEEPSK